VTYGRKNSWKLWRKCIPKVTFSTKHNLPWMRSTLISKQERGKETTGELGKLDAHLYGTSTPHSGIRL